MDRNDNYRSAVLRLLKAVAGAREAQKYLQRFADCEAGQFAIIKVGGAVLRDDCDSLVSSLTFLQKLGLIPIVVHGAGPQISAALDTEGIGTHTVDGLRVTPPAVLNVVRRVLQTENLKLVDALQRAGGRAASLVSGVFEANLLDQQCYGLVGEVTRVHQAAINATLEAGAIPVIATLGETGDGRIVNINADYAAHALALEFKPCKTIFLTDTGGLLNGNGEIIDSLNLSTDYDKLMQQPWVTGGMRVKIERIHQLLDKLPATASVAIARPDQLAEELFTHKGSGTLVRRGEVFHRVTSWDELDHDRLRSLIESSFNQRLSADYFNCTALYQAWVSDQYRAALILTQENGVPYLDKFAVATDASGEGLGRLLWQAMRAEVPQLFWRARHGNAASEFYFREADGSYKGKRWMTFWYGLPSFRSIEDCVTHCDSRAATLGVI